MVGEVLSSSPGGSNGELIINRIDGYMVSNKKDMLSWVNPHRTEPLIGFGQPGYKTVIIVTTIEIYHTYVFNVSSPKRRHLMKQ